MLNVGYTLFVEPFEGFVSVTLACNRCGKNRIVDQTSGADKTGIKLKNCIECGAVKVPEKRMSK